VTAENNLSFSQWCIECRMRNDFTLESIVAAGTPMLGSRL